MRGLLRALIIVLFFSTSAFAQGTPLVKARESDGSPSGVVTEFIFANGNLTKSGTKMTVADQTTAATNSKSFIITSPTSAADGAVWRTPQALTITAVHLLCVGGTNIIGHLDEMDADGGGAAGVDGATDITSTGTNANDDGSLSNASIDANDYIGWHTTSVSGSVTKAIITFEFTVP